MKGFLVCTIAAQLLLGLTAIAQQEASAVAAQQSGSTYHILGESTFRQKDGATITFREVVPPVAIPQAQPVALPAIAPAQTADINLVPLKETTMLSISASVHANGQTVLRWTCGSSQRLYAVSNVDFRYLEGIANLHTDQRDYFIILSAGADEQDMSAAEVQAAQALPEKSNPVFSLVAGMAPSGVADESALDAMEAVLDYYAANKDDLVAFKAQRDADRIAREQAQRNAPPAPPRQSTVHFWKMQPGQGAAIIEKVLSQKGVKP